MRIDIPKECEAPLKECAEQHRERAQHFWENRAPGETQKEIAAKAGYSLGGFKKLLQKVPEGTHCNNASDSKMKKQPLAAVINRGAPRGTQVAAIRNSIRETPNKPDSQIARELGAHASNVRKYRKELESKGVVAESGKGVDVTKYLDTTDVTVQMFLEYLGAFYTGMPQEVFSVLSAPTSYTEEAASHSIIDGLETIQKTISLLLAKIARKLRVVS